MSASTRRLTAAGAIVEFLKRQQISKEKQQAIWALAAVGLGLLLLFSLNKEQ